ncbi:biotin--[acetyl-CoA-carboxylase] ligase [Dongia rigui]|uniref:biotin--[biotin carboxyl-carrier protein] ligase n=1 Tax=Dongia rigui TaxID=940149 RepID=A0ABU5DUN1_9PROT|nr:biotin--[acetyl-CoA-carboxylase] ligase [Dongia rigui]MDY0870408.1 biotin--[acetyl-CoA-carboxylase] ligase [Dongia rigui]
MSLIFRVETLAEIDSTNDALKARAMLGAEEGIVLRADVQTAGKGRRGRFWVSEAGNLYTSLLLRPTKTPAEAATLGFVMAIALGRLLRAVLNVPVEHKWPNDVLVDGAKISGILLESGGITGGKVDWLVLGIGVNLRHHPAETLYPTTDLLASGGPPLTPDQALDLLLAEFRPLYAAWVAGGFAALRADWLAHCRGLGDPIMARLERGEVSGRFEDIDADGTLLLRMDDGALKRIAAGDIFLVARPAA